MRGCTEELLEMYQEGLAFEFSGLLADLAELLVNLGGT